MRRQLMLLLGQQPAVHDLDWSMASTQGWLDLIAKEGVDGLVEQAMRHGTQWPDAIREALKNRARHAIAREMVYQSEIQRVLGALDAQEVRPILLKGAGLGYSLYPQTWLRPRVDVDLFIKTSDVESTDVVYRELGYEPETRIDGEMVSHQETYTRRDQTGLIHVWDLHTKLTNPHAFAEVLVYDEVHEQAIPVPALGQSALRPCSVHALLHACIHRVAHHAGSDRLIWLYDIHLLSGVLGEKDWRQFRDIVVTRKVSGACQSGLTATQNAFGTQIPDSVLNGLAQNLKNDPSHRRRFVQATLTRGSVLSSDLAALPSWSKRFCLLREHLFPSAAYMRERFNIKQGWLLPFYYVYRGLRGALRLRHRVDQ